MPQLSSSRRASSRPFLIACTVLLVVLSVLGSAGTASATAYRTWTLSGVTFNDGGQASGSFRVSDAGRVDQIDITTSGGQTYSYGASTVYDDANSSTYSGNNDGYLYVEYNNLSRVIRFKVGDLTTASDGEVRAIDTNGDNSYECLNCAPYRTVSSGSLVAGTQVGTPTIRTSGAPTISGTPKVGQVLTGDDSTLTTTPTGTTGHYQWLRDGLPIPGKTTKTYTLTAQDAGSYLSWEVVASKAGYSDSVPVDAFPVGPIQGAPTPARIGVVVPPGLHLGGRPVEVRASDLEAGQRYTMSIAGHLVGSGTAPASGSLARTVVVPTGIGDRATELRIAGPHRVGSAVLRVVQAKKLGLTLTPSVVHRHRLLTISVSGLAAGELVRVKYRNHVVSPDGVRAAADGTYHYVIRVGWLAGTKTVRVIGRFHSRFAMKTFTVIGR